MKISSVGATTLHTQFYCENGGGAMENLLFQIILLLLSSLVGITLIAFALIITLVIILSK